MTASNDPDYQALLTRLREIEAFDESENLALLGSDSPADQRYIETPEHLAPRLVIEWNEEFPESIVDLSITSTEGRIFERQRLVPDYATENNEKIILANLEADQDLWIFGHVKKCNSSETYYNDNGGYTPGTRVSGHIVVTNKAAASRIYDTSLQRMTIGIVQEVAWALENFNRLDINTVNDPEFQQFAVRALHETALLTSKISRLATPA